MPDISICVSELCPEDIQCERHVSNFDDNSLENHRSWVDCGILVGGVFHCELITERVKDE